MNKIIFASFILLFLTACNHKKPDKENAKMEYKTALTDSVKAAERKIDSISNGIADLNEFIDSRITGFAYIDNPREVEGYYILRNWSEKYPLNTTGIIARITKSEQLELVATLKGLTFDQIEVVSGETSIKSSVVPHDQALNYRIGGLNTVMFSGHNANEIGEYIANNELNPVKIIFLEKGKVKTSWQITSDFKKMISNTWMLASSMQDLHSLELLKSKLHQKIDILRKHIN